MSGGKIEEVSGGSSGVLSSSGIILVILDVSCLELFNLKGELYSLS